MTVPRTFTFHDGREVTASSPVHLFEKLKQQEYLPPAELGRYLDLLRSRAALAFGIDLDVGGHDLDIVARCQQALASLVAHGWVRLRRG
jgi:hypothetical protein